LLPNETNNEQELTVQIEIEAENDSAQLHVQQMLRYYLTGLDGGIERFRIVLQPTRDRLDTPLYRCTTHAVLSRGGTLDCEEMQADMDMAITRVLDRTVRAVRRRSAPRVAGGLN
jgi:hypothetical protein